MVRKYPLAITLAIKSPDGQDLGTVSKTMDIDVDMADFSNNTDADEHMMQEVGEMLSAAEFHIGNCFN